jgi:predicted neutral ceramidase superfamily lipid hydrolase
MEIRMTDLEKTLRALAAKTQETERQQRIDVIIKVTSALYDKAVAYTNVIIIAGYVAFFAIWNTMKANMSRPEMLLTAFCMTFSLVFFVFWEVTKMIINSKSVTGLMKVLNAPPQEFDKRLAEQQKADQRLNVRLMKYWIIILALTVVPGLVAGAVLLVSFGRQLWGTI